MNHGSGFDWQMLIAHFFSMILAMGVYDLVKTWLGKKH